MFYSMYLNLIFSSILFISPLFCMSCNNWFSLWLSMELNLMSFIPFLISNKKFNDSIILYYLIQSFSSSIFFYSSLIFYFLPNSMNIFLMNLLINMMMLSMLIKLGMIPFHYWFINLMNSSSWMNCLIISTWQKIIPMIILFNLPLNKFIFMIFILMSTFFSMILSFNLSNLRLMMSYSSINHSSWILIMILLNKFFWIYYMLFYSMIFLFFSILFNIFYINYINQLILIYLLNNSMIKLIIFCNFISLGGLPPFLGFLYKWFSIYYFIYMKLEIQILFLIMCSLGFLYIYINMFINMMLFSFSNNINFTFYNLLMNKFNYYLYYYIFLSFSIFSFFLFLIIFYF